MGHNIRYYDYPEKVNKNKVQSSWTTLLPMRTGRKAAAGFTI